MPRRTKIVATLGPATDDPKTLDEIIAAGVDVVRLNMSHGSYEEHQRRAEWVRDRARASGRQVGVLIDLQGPKIRIARFENDEIKLAIGDKFIIDTAWDKEKGNQERVGTGYSTLHEECSRGDTLLLNDGLIVLWVEEVAGSEIRCQVKLGGKLSNNKGINKQGGGLSAPALTDKDLEDIKFAASIEADYLAVSFVQTGEDCRRARDLLREAGGQGGIVAKVERAEALNHIDDIINASDVIMVARGDLGVEIGDAELPAAQKMLISRARQMNCVVITATQMMESMIENPIPTRAEVFDVANAVIDGTDAIMLSAESAAGKYPVEAVEAMNRVCIEAEKQSSARRSDHRLHTHFEQIDESIAMATMYTANHLGVAAIAALTESGATTKWMSRISSGIPIYAMTSRVSSRRKVTLYRGVYPVSFALEAGIDSQQANVEIIEELQRRGAVRDGDMVIITKGDLNGIAGGTNVMKVIRVGDHQVK
jgi:pyruvate kinase